MNLEDCEQVKLPEYEYDKTYNYHQFVIMVPRRDELQKWLKACHIETMVHYRELPYELFHTRKNHEASHMAYFLSSRVLSLPIANVTMKEVKKISESIKEFYGKS